MAHNRFARNSIYGALAGLCTSLSNFAGSIVVARVLGVEGSGAVAFSLWIIATTGTITDLGIPASLARYLPELTARGMPDDARRLTATALRWYLVALSLILALVVFGLAFGLGTGAAPRFGAAKGPVYILLLGLCCLGQGLGSFAGGVLKGTQDFRLLAKVTLLGACLQLLLIAAGSWLLGVYGVLLGYAIGTIPFALPIMRAAGRTSGQIPPDLRARVRRYALFSWAAAVAAAFVWARTEIGFLEHFRGHAAVGLFTAGLTIANMATQGPLLLTTGLLPFFSERFGENAIQSMHRAHEIGLRMMSFLLFPACFGTAAILPALLPLIYGQHFEAAVPAAEILVAGAALGAATVTSNVVNAMERSDFIFYSSLLGIVISVASGLTIIPRFGAEGAAISRCAMQLLLVALGQWFVRRRFGFPFPYLSIAKLLLAAGLCAAVARLVLELCPAPWSLPGAIIAGAATYVLGVRSLGALPRGDADLLLGAARAISTPIERIVAPMLRLIVRPEKTTT